MERDAKKHIKKYQKLRLKAHEKGDLKEEAECLNYLGELHTELGEHEESLSLHKEELGLCQATEDKIGQAVAHRKVGECYAALGNYKRAVQHQQKHLELAKVSKDLPEQQRAYTTIGRTYLDQGTDFHFDGDFEKAKPCFKEAESAFRTSIRLAQTLQESKILPEKEIHQMKARSIMNLAMVYHYMSLESNEKLDGNYAKQSLAFNQKAISISQRHMLSQELLRTHINLYTYYRSRSCVKDAIRHAEEALRCAKVARNTLWKIEALGYLGDVHLYSGNCEASKNALKKSFRLTNSPEEKNAIREKLTPVVKILHLQSNIEGSSSDEKFKIFEKIADKFAEKGCFQAAIVNYKKQEDLFPEVENITNIQKSAVYYSLAITSSDLNDHQTAIKYYRKEMEFYSEPKELAKTWTQIGLCMEKLSKDVTETEDCYSKAIEYAEQTDDNKLLLKALNLLLSLQDDKNSPSAAETIQKISEIQLKSGILVVDGDEDSEEMCGRQQQEDQEQQAEGGSDSEDIESLVDKELEIVSSDDSDAEENRKSRLNGRIWKRKLNEKGETALHRACIDGHMKRVQLLLEQGHPINTPDYAGWSPLHEACIHGFTEIAKVLLNHGANINCAANCGTTPIVDAASNGHLDVVELLVEKGADATIKNKRGDSALGNLEYWFSENQRDLDSYETEGYSKIHESLRNSLNNSRNHENTNQNEYFGETLRSRDDLFDAELFSQRTNDPPKRGLTQVSMRAPPQRTHASNSQLSNYPSDSQRIDDFGLEPDDPIFNDSQILPQLDPKPRTSKSTLEGSRELQLDGANEYMQAMARLGGSDSLNKFSNVVKSQRAPKRPGTDQIGGLICSEDYVGDDWLIDDLEEVGSNPAKRTKNQIFKQPKNLSNSVQLQMSSGNCGWRKPTFPKKSFKDTNSGAFTSSFLNQDNSRGGTGVSKRLITTKIRDFIPESSENYDIIIDDYHDNPASNVPQNNFPQSSVPSTSFANNVGTRTMVVPPPQATQAPTMRIKVKIQGKMFLIAVPGSNKTIEWLCERASLVYKQTTGLQPKLSLYAGGTKNEEEACLLSNDDLVSDVLQTNEHVTAKIESWEAIPLSKKYQESCKEAKQVVMSTILSACEQSSTTERIDLKNLGLPHQHLKCLVTNLTQQEVTSLQLPGNSLRDDGASSLCEALQKQLTLDSLGSYLSELNLRCTNLKRPGLKKLAQAAENGVFKDLKILDLSCNRFGDLCSEDLATLVRSCKSLKYLSMSRCRFTHKMFHSNYPSFKSAIKGCITLTTVDFSHNLFGSVGVELLLKSLPQSYIIKLDISGVCDTGNNSLLTRNVISYLKQEDCCLQTLHLSDNQLNTMQLTEFIRDLKSLPQHHLQRLDVSKNVTSSSLERRLVTLLNEIKSIEEINVSGCRLVWRQNNEDTTTKRKESFDSAFGALQPQALFT